MTKKETLKLFEKHYQETGERLNLYYICTEQFHKRKSLDGWYCETTKEGVEICPDGNFEPICQTNDYKEALKEYRRAKGLLSHKYEIAFLYKAYYNENCDYDTDVIYRYINE